MKYKLNDKVKIIKCTRSEGNTTESLFHQGKTGSFGLGEDKKIYDFGYRCSYPEYGGKYHVWIPKEENGDEGHGEWCCAIEIELAQTPNERGQSEEDKG